MNHFRHSISALIDGATLTLYPIGEEELNGWKAQLPQGLLLRSSRFETPSKAKNFFHLIEKRRIVSCQLAIPALEWGQIEAQHAFLTSFNEKSNSRIAHLILPTNHLFKQEGEKPSEFFLQAMDKLRRIQNITAWEWYCHWMAEEVERVYNKLKLEELDTYTLEAHFKDFLIESDARERRQSELEVVTSILKIAALRGIIDFPLQPEDNLPLLERALIRARSEGKQRLVVQHATLEQIVHIINIIEEAHPELFSIKKMAVLLVTLMGNELEIPGYVSNWGQQLMLMQLLHEEMGIVSALNCDTGIERTNLAFALQAAISVLKQVSGFDNAWKLATNWESEVSLRDRFRDDVLKILDTVCIPLTAMRKNIFTKKGVINLDFLDYLPEKGIVHDERDNKIPLQLYHLNPQTRRPENLTPEGEEFVQKMNG